jgi:integrase
MEFKNKKPKTQKTYRYALTPLVNQHGQRSISGFDAARTEAIIAEIGGVRPAMANLTKWVLARVFKHIIKLGWRHDNPTLSIENFKGGEHHTWTDEELAKFEKRWAVGTRERLAYALCLYTDQRVGDVVKLRRSDVHDGTIRLTQEKTDEPLTVPIHPALRRALDAYPAKGLTLIGKHNGAPLSAQGLSRLLERAAKEASLPVGPGVPKATRCVAHGLRKALQRKLAESGATTKQMQAISGHTTLKQVERYSARANQKHLAERAMALIADQNEG